MEEPTVATSANIENYRNTNKGSWAKWILPFLSLVILAEVILGLKTLTSPIPADGEIGKLYGAQISLAPSKNSYKVGEYVPVAVRVATGGLATVGTDLILKFDPAYLNASGQTSFLRGQIYKDYPVISIDNSTGIVKVSGVDSPGESGYSGIGILGEMVFTAKKEGKTSLEIQFKPGATNLSNVIEIASARNLIDKVFNATIDISNSSHEQTNLSPSCSPRTQQICQDDQGRTGSQWCTDIRDPAACQTGCFKEKTGDQVGCKVVTGNLPSLPSQKLP